MSKLIDDEEVFKEKKKQLRELFDDMNRYLQCHDYLVRLYNKFETNPTLKLFLDENNQPIPEFFDMVHDYEKRLEYAKNNTSLPDNPNYKKINEFVYSVNERVVKGEIV